MHTYTDISSLDQMDCRISYYSFPSKLFIPEIPKSPRPMVQNIFVTEIFASNKHIFEAKNGTLSYKYIWYLVWNYLVFFLAKRIFMNKSVATINKIGFHLPNECNVNSYTLITTNSYENSSVLISWCSKNMII